MSAAKSPGRTRSWLAAGLLAFAFAAPAAADPDASALLEVAPEHARDRGRLRVRELARLHFGRVVAGRRSGAVIVDPVTCARQVLGDATDLGGFYGCAEYVIHGTPNTRFRIALPGRQSLRNGRGRVLLTDFTSNPSGTGVIGPLGLVTVTVGATLELEGAQPAGEYSGTYPVLLEFD